MRFDCCYQTYALPTLTFLDAQAELEAVLQQRAAVDATAEQLAARLIGHPETSHLLIVNNGWLEQDCNRNGEFPFFTCTEWSQLWLLAAL